MRDESHLLLGKYTFLHLTFYYQGVTHHSSLGEQISNKHTNTHTNIHVYILHIFTHKHTLIYIYIHTHIYTNVYIYTVYVYINEKGIEREKGRDM